jgi:hypothetical protein
MVFHFLAKNSKIIRSFAMRALENATAKAEVALQVSLAATMIISSGVT